MELRISNRMTLLFIIRYKSNMLLLLVAGVALTCQITADSESESFGIVTVSQVLLNVWTCRHVGPRDHEGRRGGRGCGGDSISGIAARTLLTFTSKRRKIDTHNPHCPCYGRFFVVAPRGSHTCEHV